MKNEYTVIDAKGTFNNEITNYIHTTFTLDTTTMLVIDATRDFLEENNCSYESYNHEFLENEIFIPSWIFKLIKILNDANIDLSIYELIREKILVPKEECR